MRLFIDELKRDWSPAAQTLPTDADRAAIAAMDGAWLVFEKMGVRLEATRHAVLTSSIPNVKLQYDSTATSHAKRRRETL